MQSDIMEAIKTDFDLAWFFGFSIGDGYSTYGRYGVDTATQEIVNLLIDNLKKLTRCPIKAEVYGDPNKFDLPEINISYYKKRKPVHSEHIKIKIDNVKFADEILDTQNRIFENMMKFPRKSICYILRGFFDAEATVSPNGMIEIDLSPNNLNLAKNISNMLKHLDIENKVFIYSKKNRISIPGGMKKVKNLKKFRENINFTIQKKRRELNDMISVYSLPVDKRPQEEIETLLLDLLREKGCMELKNCMRELNVKVSTLKRCANRLSISGRVRQSVIRKRVCLLYN